MCDLLSSLIESAAVTSRNPTYTHQMAQTWHNFKIPHCGQRYLATHDTCQLIHIKLEEPR